MTCSLNFPLSFLAVSYTHLPGKVEDAHALLHHGDGFGIDHPFCVLVLWHMDGDIVALLKDLFKGGGMDDVSGKAPGRIYRNIWVIPQHLHIQVGGGVCHTDAYGAQTDDAQFFTGDLRADELALALFHQFRYFNDLVQFPGILE